MIAELNRESLDHIIMLVLQKKSGTLHPSFLPNLEISCERALKVLCE